MLANQAQACTVTKVLSPISAAATANATSSWISVSEYEGDIVFVQSAGAITGTLDGKIQDATDGSGTSSADVTGATFTQVTAGTDEVTEKLVVSANKLRSHIRYVGTIVTGPALVSVEMIATKKYV